MEQNKHIRQTLIFETLLLLAMVLSACARPPQLPNKSQNNQLARPLASPENVHTVESTPLPATTPQTPSLVATSTSQHPTPRAALVGPTWLWQSTSRPDNTLLIAEDSTQNTLQFQTNGQLTINTNCGHSIGTYTRTNGGLSLSLPETISCPPDSPAAILLQDLPYAGTYTIDDDNRLIIDLQMDGGTLIFVTATSEN